MPIFLGQHFFSPATTLLLQVQKKYCSQAGGIFKPAQGLTFVRFFILEIQFFAPSPHYLQKLAMEWKIQQEPRDLCLWVFLEILQRRCGEEGDQSICKKVGAHPLWLRLRNSNFDFIQIEIVVY